MKKSDQYRLFVTSSLFVLLLTSFVSCSKEEVKLSLIDPRFQELVIHTGFTDNVIEIQSDGWSVAYVKDGISGELLKDIEGKPIRIEDARTVQLQGGWLELEKTVDHKLRITLAENFSSDPREFSIGLESGNKNEEMRFVQTRGERYEIIDTEVSEIEGSRKVYLSEEGTVLFENNSYEETFMDLSDIFKDVTYTSELLSEDYGTFDWINNPDSMVFLDDIQLDGAIVWSQGVPFKEGVSTSEYINRHSTNLAPFSSLLVKGEMKYIERTSEFTLTLKNVSSGNQFKVSGIWNQKVPITPHFIFDK